MHVMLEEQETHISWGRLDDRVKVYVSDRTVMTKLDKLVATEGSEWKLDKISKLRTGEMVGKFYSCPIQCIAFRAKPYKMNLTDEERAARAERMKQLREKDLDEK